MRTLDLTSQCDATASGTENAYFTWILVNDEDALPAELTFCAHHNGVHFAALTEGGWTQVPATVLEQTTQTVNA